MQEGASYVLNVWEQTKRTLPMPERIDSATARLLGTVAVLQELDRYLIQAEEIYERFPPQVKQSLTASTEWAWEVPLRLSTLPAADRQILHARIKEAIVELEGNTDGWFGEDLDIIGSAAAIVPRLHQRSRRAITRFLHDLHDRIPAHLIVTIRAGKPVPEVEYTTELPWRNRQ